MRRLNEFRKAGHWPTLLSGFLYFDTSFMIWTLLGALGNYIGEELHLSTGEKALVTALPILAGAGLRVIFGALADRFGCRLVGLAGMGLTFLALLLGWAYASSLPSLLLVGLLLGVPGASFAVALPLVSRWYPTHLQGVVLGVAGMGNSGTVLAALLAPRLAESFGWQQVFLFMAIPLLLTAVLFFLTARDAPLVVPTSTSYWQLLREQDTLWFCFFYSFTFGSFVGLTSFLAIFFREQYGVDRVLAGNLTALCVLAASTARPLGGYLADRMGGVPLLAKLFPVLGLLMVGLAQLPPLPLAVFILCVGMAGFGLGNGGVFKLVSQRFHHQMGGITGLVGAAGGLGGFLLPSLMGLLKDATGTFGPGFLFGGGAGLAAFGLLLVLHQGWRLTWLEQPSFSPVRVEVDD